MVDGNACRVATSDSTDVVHAACFYWLSAFVMANAGRDTFVVERRHSSAGGRRPKRRRIGTSRRRSAWRRGRWRDEVVERHVSMTEGKAEARQNMSVGQLKYCAQILSWSNSVKLVHGQLMLMQKRQCPQNSSCRSSQLEKFQARSRIRL